jgi:hypothetical protein
MIDKGDILSIQCKMSFRGPKYMRKEDGLSLVFIDFYVPALPPHLNITDISLQFSENVTLFAVLTKLSFSVLLPPSSSCSSMPRSCIPLLHSCRVRCRFSNVDSLLAPRIIPEARPCWAVSTLLRAVLGHRAPLQPLYFLD